MDIENYIKEAIFSETDKYRVFYEWVWDVFQEDGYVILDEEGHEIDAIIKAVSLQNLLYEYMYRVYDSVNEVGLEDIIEYCGNLGFQEEDIVAYCESNEEIFVEDDIEATIKSALDTITELTADKMLEEFDAGDIFDAMFCASYDFEQDFVYAFEDYEELLAFIDANQEKLDQFKEDYETAYNWIESGMIC